MFRRGSLWTLLPPGYAPRPVSAFGRRVEGPRPVGLSRPSRDFILQARGPSTISAMLAGFCYGSEPAAVSRVHLCEKHTRAQLER